MIYTLYAFDAADRTTGPDYTPGQVYIIELLSNYSSRRCKGRFHKLISILEEGWRFAGAKFSCKLLMQLLKLLLISLHDFHYYVVWNWQFIEPNKWCCSLVDLNMLWIREWPELAPDICSGRILGFLELFASANPEANTCAYLSGLTIIIPRLKRGN